MKITKKINVNLDIKITCRKCEELMAVSACLRDETYFYLCCPKCNHTITLNITTEGYK